MSVNSMQVFETQAPEVFKAFNGLLQSIIQSRGLDVKTKQLIYIAIKAALGDTTAVSFHIGMAKQAGATLPEISDAILMTLTTSGISGVAACLPMAVAAFETK
ncbi:carboxymuconolactone decarboxylase family protein [Ferruginibacter sp. HRS2-29]|uniref:carboxymuconolactone decarboxylase family protein n=1 Tax=Ferruginibacter sp. HRS2-29 TaxID=2487334 RepID=UPI0020CD2E58|nr:carboxymuconolactone decarboxylase family protein [Ferruginibacter sp. HRS2-29]MCP9753144.1 carboxymuconolactone decarboxylase family protein [Ferruginibacter sp. HRS2-29]